GAPGRPPAAPLLAGRCGAMTLPPLVEYGTQTERSDVRAHVCPAVRCVYVYPTASGVAVVMTGNYPLRQAYQPGWPEPTAEGYLVPPEDIPNCVELKFREDRKSTRLNSSHVKISYAVFC